MNSMNHIWKNFILRSEAISSNAWKKNAARMSTMHKRDGRPLGEQAMPEPPKPEDEKNSSSFSDRPIRQKKRVRPRYDEDDDDYEGRDATEEVVSTVIPYKNPKALIAYYLGIFGLIPCLGLILGPAAIVLGILGLRYKAKYPEAKGTAHAIVGLVLGSLEALVNWGVILAALLAALIKK